MGFDCGMEVGKPPSCICAGALENIRNRTAVVGVIGLGYVGLSLCMAAGEAGFRVIGFDIDPDKCESISAGRSYIRHLSSDRISKLVLTGKFSATIDFSHLTEADLIVICVPTPLTRHFEPDLRFIETSASRVAEYLRVGHTIILESTTYPGTTNEVLLPILEQSGLVCGRDFHLIYSPEREDPGNESHRISTTPKILGADNSCSRNIGAAFYEQFVGSVYSVSTTAVAEATKLFENIFRAVNIALVNELKIVFEPMGIDVWEVIDAAKTKPFGFMPFYPGPGLGGHCIPIDPFYLSWKAREYGVATRFVELAGQINSQMPKYVVEKLVEVLDKRQQRGLSGSNILIVGVAYKKNLDDTRESPALRLIDILEERGANVDFYDPIVSAIPSTQEHLRLAGRKSQEWRTDIAANYHAILIVTDHSEIDYRAILDHARVVVDTRNACRYAGLSGGNLVLC